MTILRKKAMIITERRGSSVNVNVYANCKWLFFGCFKLYEWFAEENSKVFNYPFLILKQRLPFAVQSDHADLGKESQKRQTSETEKKNVPFLILIFYSCLNFLLCQLNIPVMPNNVKLNMNLVASFLSSCLI